MLMLLLNYLKYLKQHIGIIPSKTNHELYEHFEKTQILSITLIKLRKFTVSVSLPVLGRYFLAISSDTVEPANKQQLRFFFF